MTDRVGILADVHEIASGIPARLTRLGASVDVHALAVGDYEPGGGIRVERKTVRDLHLTLVAGRFWRQIGDLRRRARWPILLIEGRRLDAGPVAPDAIRGVCLAVAEQGVVLLRSEDPPDSAAWLFRLGARARSRRRRDRPPFAQIPKAESRGRAAAMLCAVSGISTVTADALLASFGTIAAVVAAGPDEWQAVSGMGPRRCETLSEALYCHDVPLSPSSPRDEGRGPAT